MWGVVLGEVCEACEWVEQEWLRWKLLINEVVQDIGWESVVVLGDWGGGWRVFGQCFDIAIDQEEYLCGEIQCWGGEHRCVSGCVG